MDRKRITEELLEFFTRKDRVKLLEGVVRIEGLNAKVQASYSPEGLARISYENVPQGNVCFKPDLTVVKNDSKAHEKLWDFLKTYQTYSERGFLFSHPVEFSLYDEKRGLGLYLMQKRDWGSSEVIDVFDHALIDPVELERKIELIPQSENFVMGKVVNKRDYNGFTVLQRWFLE